MTCHSKGLLSSTKPAEKPESVFLFRSAQAHQQTAVAPTQAGTKDKKHTKTKTHVPSDTPRTVSTAQRTRHRIRCCQSHQRLKEGKRRIPRDKTDTTATVADPAAPPPIARQTRRQNIPFSCRINSSDAWPRAEAEAAAMTCTKAAVRPAPKAQALVGNDPRPPGTHVRQERASARVDERAHGACRVVAPRRGRRPSGLNIRAPTAATAAGRGPDARANVPCQRRSAVSVCGVQATACTTPQAQVAFRRARRATVREWRPGASQRTGSSRLLCRADRGWRTSFFPMKISCYVSCH